MGLFLTSQVFEAVGGARTSIDTLFVDAFAPEATKALGSSSGREKVSYPIDGVGAPSPATLVRELTKGPLVLTGSRIRFFCQRIGFPRIEVIALVCQSCCRLSSNGQRKTRWRSAPLHGPPNCPTNSHGNSTFEGILLNIGGADGAKLRTRKFPRVECEFPNERRSQLKFQFQTNFLSFTPISPRGSLW